ncbi:hypothetical protein [Nocardiopsis xinjiangensis]|nr:hypothetical protein [Nocardiopsis xinjiangensis]
MRSDSADTYLNDLAVRVPAPGGAGPVTTAQLLRHAVQSAAAAAGRS